LDANRGAGGSGALLRASHDWRGLQTVQLSMRRRRGELRARTPQYFRAAPGLAQNFIPPFNLIKPRHCCRVGRSSDDTVAELGAPSPSCNQLLQSTDIGVVVGAIGHHSTHTDIGMPVYDGGIRAYIGFLVDTIKARGGTTSRGTRRGTVIRCLILRRQIVTMARRRRGRSRVNRTGNVADVNGAADQTISR